MCCGTCCRASPNAYSLRRKLVTSADTEGRLRATLFSLARPSRADPRYDVCMRFRTLLLALAGTAMFADPISTGERDRAMSYLHSSRKLFLDATAGLSEAQAKWKPAPDKWSVFEVAEHLALAETFLGKDLIKTKLMETPAAPEKKKPVNIDEDVKIAAAMSDRSQKFQAPEPLKPATQFKDLEEARTAFKTGRDEFIRWVESRPELRDHFLPAPGMGDRDGFQWIFFLVGHTERHIAQINEVKANPGFPKR